MYVYVCIYMCIFIYTYVPRICGRKHICAKQASRCQLNEQALVCLFNIDIVDASRGCTFHCKMANKGLITVFFSNLFGLVPFSHFAAFKYNGLCTPSLRVSR